MSLKVIGANFGRTATMSLKQGLEMLGFEKCYHMSEVVVHPQHSELWLNAWRGMDIWKTIFAGYQAAVDWPTAAFWPQLMCVYPEAKIVLSIRDAEEWYASAANTIFRSMDSSLLAQDESLRNRTKMLKEIIVDGTFDGDLKNKDRCIKIYQENIEHCRLKVPSDRLIEFDASLGWKPLCHALGCKIPTKPFPHVNKAAEFADRWRHQKDPSQ